MDEIETLLRLLESVRASVSEADTDARCARLHSAGYLVPLRVASHCTCPSCSGDQLLTVQRRSILSTEPSHVVCCSECGLVDVDPSSLQEHSIDLSRFLADLKAATAPMGVLRPVVSGVLWSLGEIAVNASIRSVYFMRGRSAAAMPIAPPRGWAPADILLVPSAETVEPALLRTAPCVVDLHEVLGWTGGGIRLDHDRFTSALVSADQRSNARDDRTERFDIAALDGATLDRQAFRRSELAMESAATLDLINPIATARPSVDEDQMAIRFKGGCASFRRKPVLFKLMRQLVTPIGRAVSQARMQAPDGPWPNGPVGDAKVKRTVNAAKQHLARQLPELAASLRSFSNGTERVAIIDWPLKIGPTSDPE